MCSTIQYTEGCSGAPGPSTVFTVIRCVSPPTFDLAITVGARRGGLTLVKESRYEYCINYQLLSSPPPSPHDYSTYCIVQYSTAGKHCTAIKVRWQTESVRRNYRIEKQRGGISASRARLGPPPNQPSAGHVCANQTAAKADAGWMEPGSQGRQNRRSTLLSCLLLSSSSAPGRSIAIALSELSSNTVSKNKLLLQL